MPRVASMFSPSTSRYVVRGASLSGMGTLYAAPPPRRLVSTPRGRPALVSALRGSADLPGSPTGLQRREPGVHLERVRVCLQLGELRVPRARVDTRPPGDRSEERRAGQA